MWEKTKPFANTINQTVAAFSYKGTCSKVKSKNVRKNLNKIKILSKIETVHSSKNIYGTRALNLMVRFYLNKRKDLGNIVT